MRASADEADTNLALPLHVPLSPEATQLLSPPPGFDNLHVVTSRQEQAVSAINRDVVELVARQKVALNDVLEENQRLNIRYTNLVGTTEAWQKQVMLQAEKELVHKMARMKDELSERYDKALAGRMRAWTEETCKLKSDNAKLQAALDEARADYVRAMQQQCAKDGHAWRIILQVAFVILASVLTITYSGFSSFIAHNKLEGEYHALRKDYVVLKQHASENHAYVAGNGLKCALIKLLKPNMPHVM